MAGARASALASRRATLAAAGRFLDALLERYAGSCATAPRSCRSCDNALTVQDAPQGARQVSAASFAAWSSSNEVGSCSICWQETRQPAWRQYRARCCCAFLDGTASWTSRCGHVPARCWPERRGGGQNVEARPRQGAGAVQRLGRTTGKAPTVHLSVILRHVDRRELCGGQAPRDGWRGRLTYRGPGSGSVEKTCRESERDRRGRCEKVKVFMDASASAY